MYIITFICIGVYIYIMYYLSMYLCIYIYMFTFTDYALVIFNKNKGKACHLHTTCHLRRLGFSQPRSRCETFLATMSPQNGFLYRWVPFKNAI